MAEESNAPQATELSQHGRGQGLYAVQFSPSADTILIPLSYKIPMRTNGPGEAIVQQNRAQRQVIARRFQLDVQLNISLIIKLAFAVFILGHDASSLKLIGLVLLATFIYLYKTGALAPLIQYARQGLPPPIGEPQNAAEGQNNVNNNQAGNVMVENEIRPENAGMNQPGNENLNQDRVEDNRLNWRIIVREIRIFVIGFIASLLPGFEQHNE